MNPERIDPTCFPKNPRNHIKRTKEQNLGDPIYSINGRD